MSVLNIFWINYYNGKYSNGCGFGTIRISFKLDRVTHTQFFCGLVLYNCWGKFCSYKGKGRRLIGHGTEKAPTVTGNTFGSSSDGKENSEKDGNRNIIFTNLENKVKNPLVVCLNNNYDTIAFAFFFIVKCKIIELIENLTQVFRGEPIISYLKERKSLIFLPLTFPCQNTNIIIQGKGLIFCKNLGLKHYPKLSIVALIIRNKEYELKVTLFITRSFE